MTVLAALAIAALTWQPAPDWTDRPDPVADVRAVKGGTVRFSGAQPPKSLNAYVDGNSYTAMMFSLMYGTLLSNDSETLDFTPSLARRWAVSDDGREFVFELDSDAAWSDGSPVTADDVKWTFDAVTAPGADTGSWKMTLGGFESPEVVGPRTVRIRKKGGSGRDWRDLMNLGGFYILPSRFFSGRDFNKLEFLDAPVCGPYRVASVREQIETVFARVPNWWRANLPSCRYTCNFDRIVMRYHVDNENAFEALKKREIDVYPVYTARIMTDETHGEKFDRNWILRRRVRNHAPVGFQGFAMNLRRKPFDDVRVRRAMAMLIDRERMNRTMMSGEYFLQNSYFQDLYDAAHPCTNAFYRYDVPAAKRLLAEAGYADGFSFTFLSRGAMEDKFLALFDTALRSCGIRMEIVRKDFANWMRDMDSFSFDMTWCAWGAGVFRQPEAMWASAEADRPGSSNVTGFRNEAVDALIAAEKGMATMAERTAAYRAIDAIATAEAPYAFLWNTDQTRLLYWNKFGMPRTVLSRFGREDSVLTYWWYDLDRAEELDAAVKNRTCLPDVPEKVSFDDERRL